MLIISIIIQSQWAIYSSIFTSRMTKKKSLHELNSLIHTISLRETQSMHVPCVQPINYTLLSLTVSHDSLGAKSGQTFLLYVHNNDENK